MGFDYGCGFLAEPSAKFPGAGRLLRRSRRGTLRRPPWARRRMPASMRAATDLPALGLRRFALLFAALFAAAAAPVLMCDTLPLFDYPNHLARMHILADLARSPDLQRFYEIAWRPVPDLAMDAIVPMLAQVMPLDWAAKAFVLLTLLLLVGGAAALHRTLFGVWSAWPCLAFLLLYSRILLWGFLNYLFGLGLGLCALALWIALRRLLALVYLAMPSQLATASGADRRIPLLLGLVLVAGSEWMAPRATARRIFLAAALVLFAARLGVVTARWHDSDRLYASLLPALDRLPAR